DFAEGCFVGGRGNAANGVVVLLHGVGMDARFWRAAAGRLARRFCVIAPDLYGGKDGKGGKSSTSGKSGKGDKGGKALSLDDYAADVAAVLRAYKVRRALIVGHSLGAHVALAFARAKPKMTIGVIAMGAVFCRNAAAKKAVRRRAKLLQDGGKALLLNNTLRRWREDNGEAAEQQARLMLENADENDYANAYGIFAECGDADNLPQDANLPILFAAGEKDANATPQMAKKMAAAAGNGCHYIFAGRRHLFPLTAGIEAARLITGFYDEVCRGAKFASGAFDTGKKPAGGGKNKCINKTENDKELRRAFGSFITGVTVVAAFDGGRKPRGFTANSFASVSLHPPLVSVCLAKGAGSYEVFRAADYFSINILGEKQRNIAAKFAMRAEDKFDGVRWKEQNGAPRIAAAAAWFGCAAKRNIPCGDHSILIGEVAAFAHTARAPLGYLRGAYIRPALERQAQEAAAEKGGNIIGAIVEKNERVFLRRGEGGLTLPFASGGRLKQTLRGCGLECDFGFLYSVYARAGGGRAVVYRANWKSGAPAGGAFFALDDLPPINDSAVRVLLRRFAAERKSGGHALYVGDETSGDIHHLRA
ncbi:MAG: alpha/beta fold hydrolase, partial [Gammaproteobacteria bacterium]